MSRILGSNQQVLTSKERVVLRLIMQGKSNKEIAKEMGRAVNTIKQHVSNIREKIGARNKAHAADKALGSGLVDIDDENFRL